jgi:PhnB protein
MSARYIPEGQSPIAPYFLVEDAEGMISFLKSAFGAEERQRIVEADSLIKHAELSIDGATVFVGARARRNENSTHLYIRDVDATYTLCLSLGAVSISEPRTLPYGDRSAGIRDPHGNIWWLGTHDEK